MSDRKNEKRPRLPVFTDRFRKLVDEVGGVTNASEITGISRPTINFWYNGDRTPDGVNLRTLSKSFGVSTDYLLGLTEAKSCDTTLQAACNYTGLSDDAIKKVEFEHSQKKGREVFEVMDFLIRESFVSFWAVQLRNCVRNIAEIQTFEQRLGTDIVEDRIRFYKWNAMRVFEESIDDAIKTYSKQYAIKHPIDQKAYLAERKKEFSDMLARIQKAEGQQNGGNLISSEDMD